MDGKCLVISCAVLFTNVSIRTVAVMDTSTTSFAFVDKQFVMQQSLPLQTLKDHRIREVIDRRQIDYGAVTHITRLSLDIRGHKTDAPFCVSSLGHYSRTPGIL